MNNDEVGREKLDLGRGFGSRGHDSLYCPPSSHCFKLSPWSSPAFLGIPHIHSSTAHFTSLWGKTSQTGQVSESLDSTWKLCAVGHGSHSPPAAPEHVRQAGATLDVEITQDFKTHSEKRASNSPLVFKEVYIAYVAHIIFLTDSTVHVKGSRFVSAFG